ncbi:MAG: peptidoglycan DD-metalloendopeptidase family protein, partial [Clostridia bacterium]|nr:peptidoglycan DD-metalloendopeptidase family protein [Clostridia bacterium]
ELSDTVSFNLNDAYFLDDDVPFAPFCGEEAEQIIIPVEEEAEAPQQSPVKEDLPTEKVKTPAAKQTKKQLTFSTEDISYLLYRAEDKIEYIGEETVKLFRYIFTKLSPVFRIPFLLLVSLATSLFRRAKALPKRIHLSISDDTKRISLEIKAIIRATKAVKKKRFSVFTKAMVKYFLMSFNRHSHFWKTIFNLALPAATCCLVLLIGSAATKDSTFALEVIYNGNSLGYIENTETFEKGRSQALSLLSSSEDNSADSLKVQPVYKLSRVKINQLSNAQMISEGIISGSGESYVRACGVYIDGEFICAVRNESDAASVFSKILSPYQKKADEGTIVSFVEEIEYVQGYYKQDSSLIWDTTKLQDILSKPKSEAKYHKVQKGDSLASVAKEYGLTRKQLRSLNPGKDFSEFSSIKKLLVAEEENYIRVKVMKTRTRKVSIAYETIERQSSTLAKGTKKTSQNGVNGQKVITELVTYINGEISYTSFVSEKITKNPVNKIVLVGTKTYSSPVYSGSVTSRGFTWPTRGAYNISSRYGYRNPSISGWGFHGGIDIIRAGGSTGVPVVASASGTVVTAYSGWSGYGHTVVINHGNGITTRYAHMQPGSICVRAGQYVYQGQQIGRIGNTGNSTGPHLHFEVLVNGRKVNPLNYVR